MISSAVIWSELRGPPIPPSQFFRFLPFGWPLEILHCVGFFASIFIELPCSLCSMVLGVCIVEDRIGRIVGAMSTTKTYKKQHWTKLVLQICNKIDAASKLSWEIFSGLTNPCLQDGMCWLFDKPQAFMYQHQFYMRETGLSSQVSYFWYTNTKNKLDE